MSDEHTLKIALLEQRFEDMRQLPERVLALEICQETMNKGLAEIKTMQIHGAKDRQTQFDIILKKIQEHNDATVLRQTATQEAVDSILTTWKTTRFIGATGVALILMLATIYGVWPK